jgi:DNA-3-methyladenine glycosylase II
MRGKVKIAIRKKAGARKRGGNSAALRSRSEPPDKSVSAELNASRPETSKVKARGRRRSGPPIANVYGPGPSIDGEDALSAGIERLLALDPVIVGKLLTVGGRPTLRRRDPGLAGLVWIIVSQQVSTASASAIFNRIEANLSPLDAANILAADDAALRRCGLSWPKMRALRALAEAIQSGSLDIGGLAPLAAEAAHNALIAIKGIGAWTADIFLLFCLGHPDAFPAGDLALQEAARLALGLKKRPDAKALLKIAERWRPLRGVAARMLWAYYRVARRGREGMALAGA